MTSLSLAPQQVALRVLFPDRYILQGFFRPSETGESLQGRVTLCPVGLLSTTDYSSRLWGFRKMG